MKKTHIGDFWFYKYRYQISYITLFAIYLSIIFQAIFMAPSGLTEKEIAIAQSSANISFSNIFLGNIVDLPFKILQKISIDILGLSNFSIKLPAIIISLATVFCIIKLSRIWFEKGVSALAAIIAIVSSQFFFIAQNGTSEILYIFYPIALILLGANFLKNRNAKTLTALSATLAISLYTPMSVYLIMALILTIFAHPHLRFIVKNLEKKHKIIAISSALFVILPLIISFFITPSIIETLFGIPKEFNISKNAGVLIGELLGFSNENSIGIISPIISLPSVILILIGLFFTILVKHTPKSYLVNIWAVILFCVCLINPHTTTLLFVPILILTMSGIQGFIQTWYTFFPKNPYARVAGLVPIVFFIISFISTSLANFWQSYYYSPEIIKNFNQDLKILIENTDNNRNLIVSESEKGFYEILSKKQNANILSDFSKPEVVVSKLALEKVKIPKNYKLKKIIVSSRKENADRFYIFAQSDTKN